MQGIYLATDDPFYGMLIIFVILALAIIAVVIYFNSKPQAKCEWESDTSKKCLLPDENGKACGGYGCSNYQPIQ